ncbi:MAG TPA: glycosyltransferase family 4 protein [Chitinophagaceae bacterium]|nr:glycosyltransferase family 4 protein [Chitinophagaceae bacterium]
MKVLFIHNQYRQSGGEDVAVEQETILLKSKGHTVETLFFKNDIPDNFFSKLKAGFQAIYNFSSALKVKRVIREFNPDIIHVHNLFFIASPSVLFVVSRLKIPVVLTLHNYRMICSNALLLRNNKVCELCVNQKFPLQGIRYKCYHHSRSATALVTAITGVHKILNTWKNKVAVYIALNEFSRKRLIHSSLELPETKMITKPNFVFDPGESTGKREDFFLFVGRIVKEKGVETLLEAFSEMPDKKIVIIGNGPEKKYLEDRFKLYNNMQFSGHLEKQEVLAAMKKCKACICPSIWYEGAPLTILEAFATGTPVIASRLGSMQETIKDGYNGLHFTAGDSGDLKNKIELIYEMTNNNTDFYKNARQTYLEKYHPDIHYDSIMNIYNQTIKNYSGK